MDVLWLGLIVINDWLLLIVSILVAIHIFYARKYQYFDKLGIKGPKPYPLVGTVWSIFTKGFLEMDVEHAKYGDVTGMYEGLQPIIMVKDKEMLKQILMKESHNFLNGRDIQSGDKHADLMMTFLRDDEWRRVRSTVSPTFSTGKLRMMTSQINECAKLLVENIAEGKDQVIDVKEYASAFSLDVIARTSFGLQVNSQKEKDNLFVAKAKKGFLTNIYPFLAVMLFLPFLKPLLKKFKFSFISGDVMQFFARISNDTMEERAAEPQQTRVDFMQLMVNAHKEQPDDDEDLDHEQATQDITVQKKGLTKDEIMAQCILFFLAGYENVGLSTAFLMYVLALNPEHQRTLYDEIKDIPEEDDVDYNKLNELSFLDMCCNESLRMYPPTFRLERLCGNTTTIKGVPFEKGVLVFVPVYSIHHDPNIYPEPEKFDPYRWTAEEKAKRSSVDYLPFGAGPRNCIAMRLALNEVKLSALYLVRKFKVSRCEKTQVPIKFGAAGLAPKNGIWLNFEKRS